MSKIEKHRRHVQSDASDSSDLASGKLELDGKGTKQASLQKRFVEHLERTLSLSHQFSAVGKRFSSWLDSVQAPSYEVFEERVVLPLDPIWFGEKKVRCERHNLLGQVQWLKIALSWMKATSCFLITTDEGYVKGSDSPNDYCVANIFHTGEAPRTCLLLVHNAPDAACTLVHLTESQRRTRQLT